MIVYHDNKYIEQEKVYIPISAPGFQYGMGFFTTMKYSENKFHFLKEHLERLNKSASYFKFQIKKCDIPKVLRKLMEVNQLQESRIKIMIYLDTDDQMKYLIMPQKLTIRKNAPDLLAKQTNRGDNPLYRFKTMNYFENIYNKGLLDDSLFDDYLFYDRAGHLLELTTSNIHFIKDGKIYTPDQRLPILPGIVRKALIIHKQTTVIEDFINIEDVSGFDSCFITNSMNGVTPVSSITINNHKFIFDKSMLGILPEEIRNL
ncbi:MAG: aminotransferase class IV [Fidelibacterota bacterium]